MLNRKISSNGIVIKVISLLRKIFCVLYSKINKQILKLMRKILNKRLFNSFCFFEKQEKVKILKNIKGIKK